MSKTVESIQEELHIIETVHEIQKEQRNVIAHEDSDKELKALKVMGVASIILSIFAIVHAIYTDGFQGHDIAIGILVCCVSMLFFMILYSIYMSNVNKRRDLPVLGEMEHYSVERDINDKVRKLEWDLLEATTNGRILRIDVSKSDQWTKNMIIEVDGVAREYYVSFPRDEDNYATASYYEFVAKKNAA